MMECQPERYSAASGAAIRYKNVMFPAIFEGRLILNFLSSLDLELMKNARSPKIWAP